MGSREAPRDGQALPSHMQAAVEASNLCLCPSGQGVLKASPLPWNHRWLYPSPSLLPKERSPGERAGGSSYAAVKEGSSDVQLLGHLWGGMSLRWTSHTEICPPPTTTPATCFCY